MSLEDIFLELTTDDATATAPGTGDDTREAAPGTGDDPHEAATEERIDG